MAILTNPMSPMICSVYKSHISLQQVVCIISNIVHQLHFCACLSEFLHVFIQMLWRIMIDCFKKALTSGKGSMLTKTQLIPTNKTSGKKYQQKELLQRAIIADPSGSNLPQPAGHSIKTLVLKLLNSTPPKSEHEFIISAINHLKEDLHRHFKLTLVLQKQL